MKRLFIVLILALSATISNAQSIEKQAVYKYGLIVYLDGNGVPKDSMEAQGIILLAKFGNQEMISITIGDQEVHTGLIYARKRKKWTLIQSLLYILLSKSLTVIKFHYKYLKSTIWQNQSLFQIILL